MPISKAVPEATRFINVDLDIYSISDLAPLVSALGRKIIVLYAGRTRRTYEAHLELCAPPPGADVGIRRFCVFIQSLPDAVRRLWDRARIRDFNVGVQAEALPFSYPIALSAGTINAISALNARIVFTIYAPEPNGGLSRNGPRPRRTRKPD